MNPRLECSIGIIVHNEASNIGKLIQALLDQKLQEVSLKEIIVVSSASTDGTDDIVRKYQDQYQQIKLITETERRGKSAAINKFIKAATTELLVIESGDTIPAAETVEKLISPFLNPEIGMTGGRPVPENDPITLIGYSVNLLWRLHHRMALIRPKLGEMVAFRKLFEKIPEKSAVDEASIEAIIQEKNLQLKYIPQAIVYNKGPENLSDFIKQRRRIAAGHIWLQQVQNYEVSSQKGNILLNLTIAELKSNFRQFPKLLFTMLIEIYSRLLGWYDLKIRKRNPFKWEIAASTKKLEHNGNKSEN